MADNRVLWSYSVGWRGYAFVNGQIVLATSANFSIDANPIFASGNTGQRFTQPAGVLNYEQISGSVDIEVTSDSYESFTGFYSNAGVAEGATVGIYPAYEKGFVGRAWAESLGFSGSADSLVTSSLGFRSHTGNVTDDSGSDQGANAVITTTPADPSAMPSTTPSLAVIPYYDTRMAYSDTKITDSSGVPTISNVMDWSIDDSSEVSFVKFCGSGNDNRVPDYVLLGGADASGSFTLFDVKQGSYYNDKYIGIEIGDKYIYSNGKIIVQSTGSNVQTGGSAIQSDVSFTMVGGVWSYV